MGELRDKLCMEALPFDQWIDPENQRPLRRAAIREASHALPAPFNRKNGVPERAVLSASIATLGAQPGVWFRRIEGGGVLRTFGDEGTFCPSRMRGMADILALICGKFVAIEIKTCGGRLAGSQLGELQRITRCGGIGVVACLETSLEKLISDIKNNNTFPIYKPWSIIVI